MVSSKSFLPRPPSRSSVAPSRAAARSFAPNSSWPAPKPMRISTRRWAGFGQTPGAQHLRLLLRPRRDQQHLRRRGLAPDARELAVDPVLAERRQRQAADPLVFLGGGERAALGQVGDDALRELGAGHGRGLAD